MIVLAGVAERAAVVTALVHENVLMMAMFGAPLLHFWGR